MLPEMGGWIELFTFRLDLHGVAGVMYNSLDLCFNSAVLGIQRRIIVNSLVSGTRLVRPGLTFLVYVKEG